MRPFDQAELERLAWCERMGVGHLREWYGRYAGQDLVICALGHSLRQLHGSDAWWTMGINDVVRMRSVPGWEDWRPDFLCLLDRVMGWQKERKDPTYEIPPRVATFQRDANEKDYMPNHPTVVDWTHTGAPIRDMVRLLAEGKLEWWHPKAEQIPHCHTTAICAAGIGWRLGFKTVGILGMDFTAGYAWDPENSRTHQLWDYRNDITEGFGILAEQAAADGCEIVNLSNSSPCYWGKTRRLDDMQRKT